MGGMKPNNFTAWRKSRGLADEIPFGTDRSYYGKCLRSRLGALFLTNDELVHWSYDPKDAQYAIFEKEIKISIPLETIKHIKVKELSLFWRIMFMNPKAYIKITTKNNEHHEIILYEDHLRLFETLSSFGIAQ